MEQAVLEHAAGREFGRAAQSLFGNVRLDFPEGDEAGSRLVSAKLGDCRLSWLSAGSHTVVGDDVARHSYDPDAIKLIIQSHGHSEIIQGGRSAIVGGAAAVIYDPTRPYMLCNYDPVQLLLLQIPRRALAAATVAALDGPRTAGSELAGLQTVLLSMMTTTLHEASRLDAHALASIGQSLIGLVRTMLEPGNMADDTSGLDLLRRRVEAYLGDNYDVPELSIADVARRMGCTPRYVFRAFAAQGTTPSDYLWTLRLDAARKRLLSSRHAGQSISEIAFSVGFSSSAHFSRAFRTRFDITPRDLRRARDGGDDLATPVLS